MKIEIERDVLQQALELAQAFARGHDDGWQSAMGHQAAHYKPYGYLYEGIAEHTRGKTLFKKIPETHLETRWWREVGPIYTSPQPAQLTAQEPLTEEQKRAKWISATIEQCTHENCYFRGIADAEAYYGITKGV